MSDIGWRKRAVWTGMIVGLVGGFVFALLFGTDSRLSAASGFSIGSVAGSFFHPEVRTWTRFAFLALLVGVLSFVWLD
jgi:hypothetical protein